jgi:dUTP pyrophosphatase
MTLELKVKLITSDAKLPSKKNKNDAGLDIYSIETKLLLPLERHIYATGIALEIPYGYVGLLWDRSGLSANNGIHRLAGVIDSDYRGEIKVALVNLDKQTSYEIKKGDKIIQCIIQKFEEVSVVQVDDLSKSLRGELGFGSSGK